MHDAGKIVAVWFDGDGPYREDSNYYKRIYELGVDMLTTDWPSAAEKQL